MTKKEKIIDILMRELHRTTTIIIGLQERQERLGEECENVEITHHDYDKKISKINEIQRQKEKTETKYKPYNWALTVAEEFLNKKSEPVKTMKIIISTKITDIECDIDEYNKEHRRLWNECFRPNITQIQWVNNQKNMKRLENSIKDCKIQISHFYVIIKIIDNILNSNLYSDIN